MTNLEELARGEAGPQVDSLDTSGSCPRSPRFKFEVSKSEIRNKFQSPKIQNSRRPSSFLGVWWIHQRFLNLGFVSDFEFRISDFSARPAVSSPKVMGHV